MSYAYDDGGRADSNLRGLGRRDCAVRAIAIALGLPYGRVRDDLNERAALLSDCTRVGVRREIYEPYLAEHGWTWTPTMGVGTGCRVHLVAEELPPGRLIARVTRHLVAVVDGVVRDTNDPSRDGTRCVYGYYRREG